MRQRKKPRRRDGLSTFSTTMRMCNVMLRCDGSTLYGDTDACRPCRAELAKRAKSGPQKLRGEPTEYEVRMRK